MNSEIEVETLVIILNHLFESLQNKNTEGLKFLSDEHEIMELLLEVEPEIQTLTGKIELKEDSSFPIKYSNMVLIVNYLDNYLEKCLNKSKLISKVPIKKLITINDLLKGEEYQLITIVEIIILISALSSKKEIFLDKVSELDEKYINIYLTFIEKFIPIESKNDGNESILNLNTSLLKASNFEGSSRILGVINDKLSKKLEETEKEKTSFIKLIGDLEFSLREEKNKTTILENKLSNMEMRLKDFTREVELSKKNNNNLSNIHEQHLLEENILISQYKNDLKMKEIEVQDKDKEIFQLKAFYKEEIKRFTEKVELLQDQLVNYKDSSNEIEKLKFKIKDLLQYKDQQFELEEISRNLDSKNRIIDALISEKQILNSQLEKITNEISKEKDKFRKLEYEHNQMKTIHDGLKMDISRLENFIKSNKINVSFL